MVCCYNIASFNFKVENWVIRLFYSLKGNSQQKFLLSHLKETLKIIYRSLLQNFCIYFTFGDVVT